jgi:hypothetical protein
LRCAEAPPGFDILFQVEILESGGLCSGARSCQAHYAGQSAKCTIVFISLSAAQSKLEADWALTSGIVRRCPLCSRDSVVGHGWRQKQSHDEHHDWITIRRGICRPCGKTITFLPVFSLPYTHYSLITRSAALRRRFVEGCSWEAAAPPVKDPDRIPDSRTLSRWFRALDCSQPPFSFLRRMMEGLDGWIRNGQRFCCRELPLSWPTVCPLLHRFWPLRI